MGVSSDFGIGFVFGTVITLIFGWFWLLYRDWVRERDAYNRPQIVVQPTSKTPAAVRRAASRASLKINLLRLGILFAIWLLVEIMFPEVARSVRLFIGGLVRLFVGT